MHAQCRSCVDTVCHPGTDVTGKEDPGASKLCLEKGEHRFPFTFVIPNIPLPFPFESSTGWIRYMVMCKIDRPWKFNHYTERLFTVIGIPIDLNTVAQAWVT